MPEDPVASPERAAKPADESEPVPAKLDGEDGRESNALTQAQPFSASEAVHQKVPNGSVQADPARETSVSETPEAESPAGRTEAAAASVSENAPIAETAAAKSEAQTVEGDEKEATENVLAEAGRPQAASETPEGSDSPEGSAEFVQLLEKEGTAVAPREVKVGERIRGKIVSIQQDHTFLDFSGRSEAMLATSEIRGADGEPLLRVGDTLSASVASVDDGVTLTLGRKRGALSAAKLRIALENHLPVSGTVRGVNKGGFDVNVGGVRAFCPLSQMDTAFVEDTNFYVGKSFAFRVLRWEDGGRNIVISRRSILKKEAAEKAQETRKHLEVGAEFEGTVTRIQSFGAFVDIGGLEGLLHVSRMGYGHIDDPASVLKSGQKIRVRVVNIEAEGTKKQRIALSLADLGPDPWESLEVQEGEIRSGKVMRLTTFGAFVQLDGGIDGLVHISELSHKRVNHPKEAVSPGDTVEVKVLRIDTEKRRVSLSIRQTLGDAPAPQRPPKRERHARPPRPREKPSAPASGQVTLTHNMADQLGALKRKLEKDQ